MIFLIFKKTVCFKKMNYIHLLRMFQSTFLFIILKQNKSFAAFLLPRRFRCSSWIHPKVEKKLSRGAVLGEQDSRPWSFSFISLSLSIICHQKNQIHQYLILIEITSWYKSMIYICHPCSRLLLVWGQLRMTHCFKWAKQWKTTKRSPWVGRLPICGESKGFRCIR